MISFKGQTWLDVKGVKNAVKQASMKPIHRMALLVERDAKISMKKGGRSTGPKGGKVQTPSQEGTPPNVQTSNLRGSIQNGPTQRGTYLVGPTLTAWYGRIHEKKPGKRKFMKPALERMAARYPWLFRNMPLANTAAGRRLNSKKGPR